MGKKKYEISPEGKKIRQECSRKNLKIAHELYPRGGNLKHGVSRSGIKNTSKRYSDRRTAEGKALASIMDAITSDLGGPENLNGLQQLTLSGITTKLICILQISKYVDSLPEIVRKEESRLIPVLANDYLKYQDSIEKSLENLYKQVKPQTQVPKLEDLIQRRKAV